VKTREEVDQFNAHNRWKKRGIAMVPTKFGISFTTKFMNQVNSEFYHIYLKIVISTEIIGNSGMI
jgi:xanthine dehydrogenase/oxidase